MFHSIAVELFNTTEIERNLFGMADDVYRTLEIFEQAAKFEARVGRPFEVLSMIFDCLVFMAVALVIVGLVLKERFVKLWQLAWLSRQREQITDIASVNKKKEKLPATRSSSVTSLPEVNDEREDDGISIPKIQTSDNEEETTLEKNMVGTAKWAKNWKVSTKLQSFGSFYETWFR